MVEFKCFLEGVIEEMPIIPAKKIDFKWADSAKKEFMRDPSSISITKCPGIFSVMGKGWIHRAYQDINVRTIGDKKTIFTDVEFKQQFTKNGKAIGPYVTDHSPEQMAQYREMGDHTMETIIKIQSPWFVCIPNGYSLLMMPIPYGDDPRFTAATGLLRGNEFLNVQLFWHSMNSEEVIKAGTPLNQMILIKDEQLNDYNSEYIDDAQNYLDTIERKNKHI